MSAHLASFGGWQYLRLAANGRHEVQCFDCRNLFWLTLPELGRWGACPHCLGWWTWPQEDR